MIHRRSLNKLILALLFWTGAPTLAHGESCREVVAGSPIESSSRSTFHRRKGIGALSAVNFMSNAAFAGHVEAWTAGNEVAPDRELLRRLGAYEIVRTRPDLWRNIYWYANTGQPPPNSDAASDVLAGFQSFLEAMRAGGYSDAATRDAVRLFRVGLDRPSI